MVVILNFCQNSILLVKLLEITIPSCHLFSLYGILTYLCVRVCLCTCVHVCVCVLCLCVYAPVCVHTCVCVPVCMWHVLCHCVFAKMCIFMYAHSCLCVCLSFCMCVFVCICWVSVYCMNREFHFMVDSFVMRKSPNCDWLWENPPVHKDNYLEKRN